jgi:hypothetical protein
MNKNDVPLELAFLPGTQSEIRSGAISPRRWENLGHLGDRSIARIQDRWGRRSNPGEEGLVRWRL